MAPLLRGEDVVGMLVVRRKTPGTFPQNTVDLIKTFAAQSVFAILNARLFKNVEARTGELARSLEDLRTAQDRLVQTEKYDDRDWGGTSRAIPANGSTIT